MTDMNTDLDNEYIRTRDIRQALEQADFAIHYQPRFNPSTEEISGLEAFLRWHHPEQGLLDACHFIPQMEQEPALTGQVDRWVLHTTMSETRAFLDGGYALDEISVNLSSWQTGEQLTGMVRNALRNSGFPARRLSLECPWRMLIANRASIIRTLHDLKDLGCSLVVDGAPLDDECLAVMQGTPVKVVKICNDSLCNKVRDEGLASATALIKRFHERGIKVIAVGIEDEAQAEQSRRAGCRLAQGNRFRSPLPAATIAEVLDMIKQTRKAFSLLG